VRAAYQPVELEKGNEMGNLVGESDEQFTPGVLGENTNKSDSPGPGVHGKSRAAGVVGDSETWHGVAGISQSTTGGVGVYGEGQAGIQGIGRTWVGVYAETRGSENGPAALWADGKEGGDGVKGHANGPGKAGVAGFHLSDRGPGIFGKGNPAGRFEGNVEVTGMITGQHVSCQGNISAVGNVNAGNMNVTNDIVLANADCAEEFDVDVPADSDSSPGTVMVLGDEGAARPSGTAYDRRVLGVVSGGGAYRPGIILDRQASTTERQPIALMGKVYCNVDSSYGAVEIGDLLVTSDTPGCAMKADDASRAFGAVIGKALRPLRAGQEMIPILVALQ
jgi:hypothetical protein